MSSNFRYHNNVDAMLWLQTSAEWHAAYTQAYELARMRVAAAIAAHGGMPEPLCVISDLDETLLDNSAYNEWLAVTGRNFNEGNTATGFRVGSWPEYCIEGISKAMPGSLEFYDWLAQQTGGPNGGPPAVFFVTSRRNEIRVETAQNLRTLLAGRAAARFAAQDLTSNPAVTHLYMKGLLVNVDGRNGDDKFTHYEHIAKVRGFQPILWLGDNASDFDARYESRRNAPDRLMSAQGDWRVNDAAGNGNRWIIFPNPVYGSYLRALRNSAGAALTDDARTEMTDEIVRPDTPPEFTPKSTALDPWKPLWPRFNSASAAPVKLRIGTFNVENLFDRIKILQLEDRQTTGAQLAKAGELQDLLERDDYDAVLSAGGAVRERIAILFHELRDFLAIRVDRGGSGIFDNPTKAPPELKVKSSIRGRADFSGSIDFIRDAFTDETRSNTMRVIQAIAADVLCIVEVEGLEALRRFSRTLAKDFGMNYPYSISIEGNDPRGIDVGLLSRYPIISIETHQFDEDAAGRIFSRDCLVATVDVPRVGPVTLLCNHLKSLGGNPDVSDMRRARQVDRIKQILAKRDLVNERLVLLGDLNDFEGRKRDGFDQNFILAGLVHHPQLTDVVAARIADESKRWSWTGLINGTRQLNRLDYMLVSAPLAAGLRQVTIERRGIEDLKAITGEDPFPTVSATANNGASDHGAIVAEFVL